MKNVKLFSYFLVLVVLFSYLSLPAYSSDEEEAFDFEKKINYGKGNKPTSITIKETKKNKIYKLSTNHVKQIIKKTGVLRKEKEEVTSPIIPSKTISFTANKNGERETTLQPVYEIKNKEDKRKMRNKMQDLYNQNKEARKNKTAPPSSIIMQRGKNEKTDLLIVRPGLDISVSPLRLNKKKEYVSSKPPAYGEDMEETPVAFQKGLKMAEGTRSNSATSLRHMAKEDEDFIGHPKGGAKKLRNFDDGKATKKDTEKVLDQFADLFIKKAEVKKKLPKKDQIIKEMEDELGTETESPSFSKKGNDIKKKKK